MSLSFGREYQSCFQQVYDVVVFGAGYAGFAASQALAKMHDKVLLVDHAGDLLWESGRAFISETGPVGGGNFESFLARLSRVGGYSQGKIDGVISEIIANEIIREQGYSVLYYADPVAVELDSSFLTGVIVATKAGLRRLIAKQWVDATEQASLVHLIYDKFVAKSPSMMKCLVFFQNCSCKDSRSIEFAIKNEPVCKILIEKTIWPRELCLSINIPTGRLGLNGYRLRSLLPEAITEARGNLARELRGAFISHCSVREYPEYHEGKVENVPDVPNLKTATPVLASQRVTWLAERFALGETAARELQISPTSSVPTSRLNNPIPNVSSGKDVISAQVAVIGAGTGGVVATIAAAREGVRTVVVEALPFPGGITTAGGIHTYYGGVRGGIQTEIDARVRSLQALFGSVEDFGKEFHPEAKRIVLDTMLSEAGAIGLYDSSTFQASVKEQRVESVLVSTPRGPCVVEALAWVDGTGEGDLASLAGAPYRLGRPGDGLLQAYTQSCGRLHLQNGRVTLSRLNFDSGYVDPTDSEDLTRARICGIAQHRQAYFSEDLRPICISPYLGIREGRHVDTEYTLEIDDLVLRRRFEDSVGYTGGHYDNHAVDFEFESDEALIFVWGCRLSNEVIACEIPYRSLIPKIIDNMWIASKALGVSQEAHAAFRMLRDIHRIGEVSGLAAAIAVRLGCNNKTVPYEQLKRLLQISGALSILPDDGTTVGKVLKAADFSSPLSNLAHVALMQECMAELDSTSPGPAMWELYKAGPQEVSDTVIDMLRSESPDKSWMAAVILSGWGDARAQPRLVEAILRKEEGAQHTEVKNDHNRVTNKGTFPRWWMVKSVPRWWVAVSLLRVCGTAQCLPELAKLARQHGLQLNLATSIAVTCARIARRWDLGSADRELVGEILESLRSAKLLFTVTDPTRDPVTGDTFIGHMIIPEVQEDYTWQVHYAIACAGVSIGLDIAPMAEEYRTDVRALVRKAFSNIR